MNFGKLLDLFSATWDLSWMTPSETGRLHKAEWARPGRMRAHGQLVTRRKIAFQVASPAADHPICPPCPRDALRVPQPNLLSGATGARALLTELSDGLQDQPRPDHPPYRRADPLICPQKPGAVAAIIRDCWADISVGIMSNFFAGKMNAGRALFFILLEILHLLGIKQMLPFRKCGKPQDRFP